MNEELETIDTAAVETFAADHGVAVAFVDNASHQLSVFNDNSICRAINASGKFSPECAEFCGRAFERATTARGVYGYECHAGLECRAVPVRDGLVAIVGRTFTRADKYRKATERAVTGDWRELSPANLFENVLLTASPDLLAAAVSHVGEWAGNEAAPAESASRPPMAKTAAPTTPVARKDASPRAEQAGAWRSFFGSLLDKDYPAARRSMLEFLCDQYGVSTAFWLDRQGDRFQTTAGHGPMRHRRLRLGLSATDRRLAEAMRAERALELGERRADDAGPARRLRLFPIGVGAEINAAVAVLDLIEDPEVLARLARTCLSVAPQLEILRLRDEVDRRENLTRALTRFSESLRRVESDDLWLGLTQSAAEILGAERASLMIFDERSRELELKAIVGGGKLAGNGELGGRVARVVFDKGEPVLIADVLRTGLPPSPDRGYKTRSCLSGPITLAGRTIGVMNFTDRAGGEFDNHALELFQAVVPQLAVAIDRATLKEKAGEFEQLSVTDPLTGLLNRRYIEARLAEEIKRSNRHGFPMSLMLLDVDHFKSYNDEFGHPAGDAALKLVATVIRDTLRGADVAARFGGEEFSILLPQTTGEEALAIAERLRHNIEVADFPHRRVTSSIGIASCSAELCGSADLVSAADQALYEAKRQGRNRVLVFEQIDAGKPK